MDFGSTPNWTQWVTLLEQELNFFRQKRVFLTGMTGWFGHWFLPIFAQANLELGLKMSLTVSSRRKDALSLLPLSDAQRSQLTLHCCDLSVDSWPKTAFDFLFLGPSIARVGKTIEAQAHFLREQESISRNYRKWASQFGAGRSFLLSSGAVYGGAGTTPFTETQPFGKTEDAYTRAKQSLEREFMDQTCGKGLVGRYFSFSGEYLPLDGSYALSDFLLGAVLRKKIELRGHPETVRSYLYLGDAVVWTLKILTHAGDGSVWNIGSSEEVRLGTLAQWVADRYGVPLEVKMSAQNPGYYCPNVSRAKTELGLGMGVSFQEGLERTCFWADQSLLGGRS